MKYIIPKEITEALEKAESALVQDYNGGFDTRPYILDALKIVRDALSKIEREKT